MKQTRLPSYSELSLVLKKTALKLPPSQVHGLICGILCGNASKDTAWESLITGNDPEAGTHEILQNLYEGSMKELQDFLFEFQLLLPTDKSDLPKRAESLTLWCQGFLTGLKLVDIPIVGRKPGEITEFINDLIEIAKMNYEQVISSEEDETAYIELVEYVRMGVIMIYQEIHTPAKTESSPHLH